MKANGALSAIDRWRSMAIICAAVMLASIGSANAQRFIIQGNTIRDTSSGLTWTQNPALGNPMNYQNTQAFVDNISGVGVWRIPTRAEFRSLCRSTGGESWPDELAAGGFITTWWGKSYWTRDSWMDGALRKYYYFSFNNLQSPYIFEFADATSSSLLYVWPVTGTMVTRTIRLDGDLAFGDVTVGSSATRTLTIYNDGNSTLTVSSISYPSGFSGSWSGTIAAGASRDVTVTFAPAAAQNYSGNLTVNSDKTSGTNTRAVSGNGYSPTRVIRLSGDLSFGAVLVGQTSARTLTIYNDGNSTLSISSISYPSGFSGNWSGTISAGGSRNVTVTFAPSAAQGYSGNLTVNSDKTSGTNTRSVSGTGVPVTRIIRLTGDLSFGSVVVGTSATRTLTIYNDGNSTLSVSGISYPAGFSGSWSGTVASGGSRDVTITFAPTLVQSYSGDLSVASDKTSGGSTVALSGIGRSSNTVSVIVIQAPGGSISPSDTISVYEGDDLTLTSTPQTNYVLSSWIINGTPTGNTNAVMTLSNLLSGVSVSAAFNLIQHTITASASEGGSIEPHGPVLVNAGGEQEFAAIALPGYIISEWRLNSSNVAQNVATYTVSNVYASASLSVNFLPRYSVNVYVSPYGSVSPGEMQEVAEGGAVALTATPDAGYSVDAWVVGSNVVQNGGTNYVVSNVTEDRDVFVAFVGSDKVTMTNICQLSGYALNDMIHTNGLFVIGGDRVVLTSTDGISWQTNTSGVLASRVIRSIAYGQSNYVAVGYAADTSTHRGVILVSSNAIDWNVAIDTAKEFLNDVAYVDNRFVAVGGDGCIFHSEDGISWVDCSIPLIEGGYSIFQSVTYGNDLYVIADYSNLETNKNKPIYGRVLVSSNACEWVPIVKPMNNGYHFWDSIFAEGRFVVVGDYGVIYYSDDGLNWSVTNSVMPGSGTQRQRIGRYSGKYVTMSTSISNGWLQLSESGIVWSSYALPNYSTSYPYGFPVYCRGFAEVSDSLYVLYNIRFGPTQTLLKVEYTPAQTSQLVPLAWFNSFGISNAYEYYAIQDLDDDGLLTWQEHYAGTSPIDFNSTFAVQAVDVGPNDGEQLIMWQGLPGYRYTVLTSTNLINGWARTLYQDIPGEGGVMVFTNNLRLLGSAFHSISVIRDE